MASNNLRFRIQYGIAVVICIGIGLGMRKFTWVPLSISQSSAGDAIWAMMIYYGIRFLSPTMNYRQSLIISLAFCYVIELSQIYHAPWIDGLRKTTLGGLVLGFGFLWSDILAYTIGVVLAVRIDEILLRTRNYSTNM